MFWPLSNRNADTAATIPGRSGQDKVRTSGRPDIAMFCFKIDGAVYGNSTDGIRIWAQGPTFQILSIVI
jgi:hypothetical protein